MKTGKVYVFSTEKDFKEDERYLIIGIFDRMEDGQVKLEAAWGTDSLQYNYRVPEKYVFYRQATPEESEDFYYSYGSYEGMLRAWGCFRKDRLPS